MSKTTNDKPKGYSIFNYILSALILVMGFAIHQLYSNNTQLKNALPYLLENEKVEYFDLVGMDSQTVNAKVINSEKPSVVFVFSRPCSPCNKNLVYWKKLTMLLKGKVNVYGIVLDNVTAAYNFSEEAKLNFNIYVPEDLPKFISTMRIKLNYPQTIIYHKGVKFQKLGLIKGDEAGPIIEKAKAIVNASS